MSKTLTAAATNATNAARAATKIRTALDKTLAARTTRSRVTRRAAGIGDGAVGSRMVSLSAAGWRRAILGTANSLERRFSPDAGALGVAAKRCPRGV